jgi:hypothetical protein
MRRRALVLTLPLLFVARVAGAAEAFVECPPGSTKKDEGGFSWCQPTVCDNDAQCAPNVCRPVGLCMQIGSLNEPGEPDGGARLMATQICQEDKQCPTKQTCSQMKRCVTQAQADKLTTSPPPAAPETKKSSCGCSAIGLPAEGAESALAAFALSALLVRARRRGARRTAR